jgi:hypothetical protein
LSICGRQPPAYPARLRLQPVIAKHVDEALQARLSFKLGLWTTILSFVLIVQDGCKRVLPKSYALLELATVRCSRKGDLEL